MLKLFLRITLFTLITSLAPTAASAKEGAALLQNIYKQWRAATIQKNYNSWKNVTSYRRQVEIRNRLLSAKAPFPGAIFATPTPPPSLKGLKAVKADAQNGTAKLTYHGPIDFGVGGEPTNNLYVISYVEEAGKWKYDGSEFVSLVALPDVRKQLDAGDLSYLESPDFRASGQRGKIPTPVDPARYIAKVYTFCPGRVVNVKVNGSEHRFQDTQDAQVVIGGGKDGRNSISFTTKRMEGSTGKEAFTVRVYLMNENAGATPVKVYEYLVNEGGAVKASVSTSFTVSPEQGRKVLKR